MQILEEPREHFSLSQMQTMLSCPYKYRLQYVDKREWDYVPSAVMFGKVTHDVIGHFNKSLMNGSAIPKQELVDAFKQRFSVNIGDSSVLYKDDDEPTQLLERGQKLIELYHEKFHQIEPIEVEMEFRLPIIDVNTGEMASRDVVGKIDLLTVETLYEVKTAGKSMPQNTVDSNLQLLMYGWAYKVIFGEEPRIYFLIHQACLNNGRQARISMKLVYLSLSKSGGYFLDFETLPCKRVKMMEIKLLQIKESTGETVSSPSEVYEVMREESKADRECMWVLHLNAKNKIIEKELVSMGTLNASLVTPRDENTNNTPANLSAFGTGRCGVI